jgi:hypothetical protein
MQGKVKIVPHIYIAGICIHNHSVAAECFLTATYPHYHASGFTEDVYNESKKFHLNPVIF